jgi:hypothetical protein
MFELAQNSFARRNFEIPDLIAENMVKVITRSSLISRFEKPRFRDFAYALPPSGMRALAKGLEDLLHENEQFGFNMTICQAYYQPAIGVFVKPTTTKRIIAYFELDHLHYHPAPTWEFYENYRATLNKMKSIVDSSLSPYNIAFTGFLMRSIP